MVIPAPHGVFNNQLLITFQGIK